MQQKKVQNVTKPTNTERDSDKNQIGNGEEKKGTKGRETENEREGAKK